ncbi:hypothetical protein ACH4E7_39245 [Kitasatospora sp. NPDC018058]|uniref:hypothetical protein n=1 Tax=Kitasatospora sp. NPDC018058 TaxID=3364025 RepID=UPI0037C0502D
MYRPASTAACSVALLAVLIGVPLGAGLADPPDRVTIGPECPLQALPVTAEQAGPVGPPPCPVPGQPPSARPRFADRMPVVRADPHLGRPALRLRIWMVPPHSGTTAPADPRPIRDRLPAPVRPGPDRTPQTIRPATGVLPPL